MRFALVLLATSLLFAVTLVSPLPAGKKKQEAVISAPQAKIFSGDAVTKWLDRTDKLPYVMTYIVKELEKRKGGLKSEGLYRLSGSATKVKELQEAFANTIPYTDIKLDGYSEDELTGVLKSFFRNNPKLFSDGVADQLVKAAPAGAGKIKEVLSALGAAELATLKYLFTHLKLVADNAATNKMHAPNLASLWAPTLFPDSIVMNPLTVKDSFKPVELMITDAATIFDSRPPLPSLPPPTVSVKQGKVAMGDKFIAGLKKKN